MISLAVWAAVLAMDCATFTLIMSSESLPRLPDKSLFEFKTHILKYKGAAAQWLLISHWQTPSAEVQNIMTSGWWYKIASFMNIWIIIPQMEARLAISLPFRLNKKDFAISYH